MRVWIWIAIAACSKPRVEPPPSPPPIASADAAIAVDAAVIANAAVDAAVIDAPPAFRAFVPPQPMKLVAATPQGKKCRTTGPVDVQREVGREVAALDAALRKKGSMLLTPVFLDRHEIGLAADARAGNVIRGPQGERWLAITTVNSCGPPAIDVALDPNSDVYIVQRDLKPRQTRKISLCEPVCGGCGKAPPPTTVVVEIPDGARLVDPRVVAIPLDTGVVFFSHDAKGRPKHCQPVP